MPSRSCPSSSSSFLGNCLTHLRNYNVPKTLSNLNRLLSESRQRPKAPPSLHFVICPSLVLGNLGTYQLLPSLFSGNRIFSLSGRCLGQNGGITECYIHCSVPVSPFRDSGPNDSSHLHQARQADQRWARCNQLFDIKGLPRYWHICLAAQPRHVPKKSQRRRWQRKDTDFPYRLRE